MDKIWQRAKDLQVAKVVVYADSSNDLFTDAACTKALEATDALDLFIQGVVCLKGTTYYSAVSCTKAGVLDFGLV